MISLIFVSCILDVPWVDGVKSVTNHANVEMALVVITSLGIVSVNRDLWEKRLALSTLFLICFGFVSPSFIFELRFVFKIVSCLSGLPLIFTSALADNLPTVANNVLE